LIAKFWKLIEEQSVSALIIYQWKLWWRLLQRKKNSEIFLLHYRKNWKRNKSKSELDKNPSIS
jgi:hypothetical protein